MFTDGIIRRIRLKGVGRIDWKQEVESPEFTELETSGGQEEDWNLDEVDENDIEIDTSGEVEEFV